MPRISKSKSKKKTSNLKPIPPPPKRPKTLIYVFGGGTFWRTWFYQAFHHSKSKIPLRFAEVKGFPMASPCDFGHSQIWGCFLFLRGWRGEGGDGFSGFFNNLWWTWWAKFHTKKWKEASAEMLDLNRDFDGDGKWNEWDVSETCWINC